MSTAWRPAVFAENYLERTDCDFKILLALYKIPALKDNPALLGRLQAALVLTKEANVVMQKMGVGFNEIKWGEITTEDS